MSILWYLSTPMTRKDGVDLTSCTAGPQGLNGTIWMPSISGHWYSVGFFIFYCRIVWSYLSYWQLYKRKSLCLFLDIQIPGALIHKAFNLHQPLESINGPRVRELLWLTRPGHTFTLWWQGGVCGVSSSIRLLWNMSWGGAILRAKHAGESVYTICYTQCPDDLWISTDTCRSKPRHCTF